MPPEGFAITYKWDGCGLVLLSLLGVEHRSGSGPIFLAYILAESPPCWQPPEDYKTKIGFIREDTHHIEANSARRGYPEVLLGVIQQESEASVREGEEPRKLTEKEANLNSEIDALSPSTT